MEISAAVTLHRSRGDVWGWYAVDHVRNHPRWDPDMHLEQISDGPIGIGTRIRRRNTRWGEPIEGEMEVVEWEPERAMGVLIRDANMEIRGRVTLEAEGLDATRLTITIDVPGLEDEQGAHMGRMMERSVENIRELIEADLSGRSKA